MSRSLLGAECEWAVTGWAGREVGAREQLIHEMLRAACHRFPHVRDTGGSSGIFFANGARFYIDCGLHPEMATPECTTPWEVARYVRAGERIMEELTREVQSRSPRLEVVCARCNVDYGGTGSTWGCHTSFLHCANPSGLPDQIIPHLISRVVYTGAGGFNPHVPWPEFCVAPRLLHIERVVSADSTGNRGIFHTKNETLSANGYNRLHILCGENLCSETAMVLMLGATALVVAMAEAGLRPGAGLQLSAPLDALHTVARDPSCRAKLRLVQGGECTAIEIQHRMLELAERNLGALPPWAGELCALWRRTLARLEESPLAMSYTLDWAIKQRLFASHAARHGVPFERFPLLQNMLAGLHEALAKLPAAARSLRLAVLSGPASPIPEASARCAAALAANGLTWDDLDRFLLLRDDLYQLDIRFGQVGPRGIFGALERQDVLDHHVLRVDRIEEAMTMPPAEGRARIRGEVIRRLSGQPGATACWQGVYTADGRVLDLNDPFAATEVWTDPVPAPQPDLPPSPDPLLDEILAADPNRIQQALEALRRRYGRTRARPRRPTETPQGPDR